MIFKAIKISLLLSVLFSCSSTLFKDAVTIEQVLKAKNEITSSDNPAKQMILKNELSEKVVKIKNAIIKDIIASPNVDYNFCVLVDIKTSKGPVECYIFSKNIKKMSLLKKGTTRVNVTGNFGRYFSMLDNYYTKIEILNASIDILDK